MDMQAALVYVHVFQRRRFQACLAHISRRATGVRPGGAVRLGPMNLASPKGKGDTLLLCLGHDMGLGYMGLPPKASHLSGGTLRCLAATHETLRCNT